MSYVSMSPDAVYGIRTLLIGIKVSCCKNASIKYNLWENSYYSVSDIFKVYLRFLCPINVLSEHYFPKIHITNLILAVCVLLQSSLWKLQRSTTYVLKRGRCR